MRVPDSNPSPASESGRPDVIDALEGIARRHGQVQAVGPEYYEAFASLRPAEVERLVVMVMINHEKEVRRISKGSADAAAVDAVSGFVGRSFGMISDGLGIFDGFGSFMITARDGPEPTVEEHAALEKALESFRPWIRDAVGRFLPWQLAQGER